MATASPNPGTPTNQSPKGVVNTPNLNSSRLRRSAGARGASSPRAQFVRGFDSDSRVSSPSSNAVATTSVVVVSAAAASSYPSSSVHDQFLNSSSAGSPLNLAVRNAESFSSSTGITCSIDDSVGEAQPEITKIGGGSINAAKKQAWSKPSSSAAEVGAVMGASSWPDLSESNKASPKSSSDSLDALADGPASASQESGVASSHRQIVNNNTSPSSASTHGGPMRQRSMKRGGVSSSNSATANDGFPRPQPPPSLHGSVMEVESSNSVEIVNAAAESSRENAHGVAGQRGYFGSPMHSGNEHQQRNTFSRRGNGGPHPRGDGSYYHSHGGRRDQDRGNQDWNHHRSFVRRDTHLQPQRGPPRAFIRSPSLNSAPFITPPMPVRPFGNPMLYHEIPSPLIYVPGSPIDSLSPMVSQMQPPHAMYFPVPDPQLQAKIVNQIEYYFSNENLIKDTYLRQNMDDQGWVSIELIAGFKKVMQLTDNIQFILDVLQNSTVVEVQDYKVRKRNDWMKWIMSPSRQFSPVSSPHSLGRSSLDVLATHFQNVALDESTMHGHHYEAYLSRSSSELNNQGQQSGGDDAAQAIVQAGYEDSVSTRN